MFQLLLSNSKIFAVACNASQTFFGLPVWYKYLPVSERQLPNNQTVCDVGLPQGDFAKGGLLIGLGVVDILLRVAGMVAVGFVIYGGFLYLASQGEPDKTKKAKDTIMNAVIGLVIVLIAAPIVSFIGNKIGAGL